MQIYLIWFYRLLREKKRQTEDEEKHKILSQPSLLDSKLQRSSEQTAIDIKNRSDEIYELKSNFVEDDQLCTNHMTSVDGNNVSSSNVRTEHVSRGGFKDQESNSFTIESYLPSLNDSVASAVVKNEDNTVKMSSDVSLSQRNEPNVKIAESSECKISDVCKKDYISNKASSEEKTPCRSVLTDSVGDTSISVVKLFPVVLPAPAKSIKGETLVSESTSKSENDHNYRLHSRTVDSSRTKGNAEAKYEPRYFQPLYLIINQFRYCIFLYHSSFHLHSLQMLYLKHPLMSILLKLVKLLTGLDCRYDCLYVYLFQIVTYCYCWCFLLCLFQ